MRAGVWFNSEVSRMITVSIICPETNVAALVRVAMDDIVHEATCPACGQKHYWLCSSEEDDQAPAHRPSPAGEWQTR